MKHCRKRPTIKPPLLKRKKTATNDLLNLKKQPKGKRKSSKHKVKGERFLNNLKSFSLLKPRREAFIILSLSVQWKEITN